MSETSEELWELPDDCAPTQGETVTEALIDYHEACANAGEYCRGNECQDCKRVEDVMDCFQYLLKKMVEYIAENAERESVFLSSNPTWNIGVSGLFDFIIEKSGVPEETVAA